VNDSPLAEAALAAIGTHRLSTAMALCEEALEWYPDKAPFWCYQLGFLHQVMAGNGEQARPWYERAWRSHEQAVTADSPEDLQKFAGFACENMMLLSLSYEEYERWAKRLQQLRPYELILQEQWPEIRELREKGTPWRHAMASIAGTYYNHEAKKGTGGGFAASIWQLLLINRRKLRVPRDEWRVAVLGYVGQLLLLGDSHGLRPGIPVREFAFALEDALPLVQEYLAENPSDKEVEHTVEALRSAVRPAGDERPPGWFRRMLHRTAGDGTPTLEWRMSAALTSAIAAADLGGLQFVLVGVAVEFGELALTFRPLQRVQGPHARKASLALRAVVGLTLPDVARRVRGIRVETGGPALYQVSLGDGVPMPTMVLHGGGAYAGPLQVMSGAGRWQVTVGTFRVMGAEDPIFRMLVPAFAPLEHKPLILPD
jgi:hypothetical protein